MILLRVPHPDGGQRIPRESGDDPAAEEFNPFNLSYSPRERG